MRIENKFLFFLKTFHEFRYECPGHYSEKPNTSKITDNTCPKVGWKNMACQPNACCKNSQDWVLNVSWILHKVNDNNFRTNVMATRKVNLVFCLSLCLVAFFVALRQYLLFIFVSCCLFVVVRQYLCHRLRCSWGPRQYCGNLHWLYSSFSHLSSSLPSLSLSPLHWFSNLVEWHSSWPTAQCTSHTPHPSGPFAEFFLELWHSFPSCFLKKVNFFFLVQN